MTITKTDLDLADFILGELSTAHGRRGDILAGHLARIRETHDAQMNAAADGYERLKARVDDVASKVERVAALAEEWSREPGTRRECAQRILDAISFKSKTP